MLIVYKFMILVALLSSLSACKNSTDPSSVDEAQANDHLDQKQQGQNLERPDLVAEQAPEPMLPIPTLEEPDPAGPDGTGGWGSQGALRPADTGNEDEDNEPVGECGNGIQEVLTDNPHCPFELYGIAISEPRQVVVSEPGGVSRLYGFHLNSPANRVDLGIISGDVGYVAAMDISPDGTIFAVGENDSNESVLMTIDCLTSMATIIGLTNAPGDISDLDFDQHGRLFAHVEVAGNMNDELGTINIVTGQYTSLASGLTGVDGLGNGLSSAPFPSNSLFLAVGASLYSLDKVSGLATPGAPLAFTPPLDDSPRINAMDSDPLSGIVYAVVADTDDPSDEIYLSKVNLNSGVVSFLEQPAALAPDGLAAIAVNRRYEECDGDSVLSVLPTGTGCSDDCTLTELICDDNVFGQGVTPIDNDFDGLANCEDPDCLDEPCNDLDGCTHNDTCIVPTKEHSSSGQCLGQEVNCIDMVGNECAMTTCQSNSMEVGDDHFQCNSMLDSSKSTFGSCTPDDNCDVRNPDGTCQDIIDLCIVGRCVSELPPGGLKNGSTVQITCESGDKELIPVEDGGCMDEESCTADLCQDGDCLYQDLDGVLCDDGDQCTNRDVCYQGTCEGTMVENQCQSDDDCQNGSTCEGIAGSCLFSIGGPIACVSDEECPINDCIPVGRCSNNGAPCVDSGDCTPGNPCMIQDQCSFIGFCPEGIEDCPVNACNIHTPGSCSCEDGNQCTDIDVCVDGSCVGQNTTDPCDDSNDCTTNDTCAGGLCLGAAAPFESACEDGNPCTLNDYCGENEFTGQCVPGNSNDSICISDPLNSCIEYMCTESGCKPTLVTGVTSCIAPADSICLLGTYECIEGIEQGDCIPVDPEEIISCPF